MKRSVSELKTMIFDLLSSGSFPKFKNRYLPFIGIFAVCTLFLGLAVSGPKSSSKEPEGETIESLAESLEFPDIRLKGDQSAQPETAEKQPQSNAPEFKQFPTPREIERIPMPDPSFGIPEKDRIPGASAYPPYQGGVPSQSRQPKPQPQKRVPVAPVIPNQPYPFDHGFKQSPQFHCDNPLLQALGQIAFAEIERNCGLEIRIDKHSGVELKSAPRSGVEFDIKIPCPPHAGRPLPGYSRHQQFRHRPTPPPAVNIATDILDQIFRSRIGCR